ncbi:MAG: hypothetical protein HKN84_00700 [Gammaproteobacteria bacterium]|nr:hypothetical protein [Gammaproteobacteria bacterium]
MLEAIPESSENSGSWRDVSTLRAFVTHLAISATIVGIVCGVIFFIWYPAPYFGIKGAWNVLRVLIGVDLVLGPLLTLILFRPGKRGLALDMTMIAMIQLSALLYGTAMIFQERPYFAVFAVDRIEVLAKGDVDAAAIAGTSFENKPLVGPVLAVATVPSDPVEFQRLLQETLFEGKPDIERRPDRWSAYAESKDAVLARARRLSTLLAERPGSAEVISRASRALDMEPADILYLPAVGGDRALTLVIDPETALPLAALDFDPWTG